MRTAPTRSKPAGFTLVELLVVIVILGILAALVSGVAVQAQRSARQAVIKLQLDQIAAAFKAYKQKYGEYPPNFNDPDAVRRHFRKAFPRMNSDNLTQLNNNFIGLTPTVQPDEAVMFWLGGFSENPAEPLTGDGGPLSGTPMSNALMEFKETRIQDSRTNLWRYVPEGLTQPFIYFNTSRFDSLDIDDPTVLAITPTYNAPGTPALAIMPIRDNHLDHFVEPQSFQILSAGLDDDWGNGFTQPHFPAGETGTTAPQGGWKDNLANFSTKNFEDSVP